VKHRWTWLTLVGLLALSGGAGGLRTLAHTLRAVPPARETRAVTRAPGSASFEVTSVGIPTYPYAHCLHTEWNGAYSYQKLDWGCYGSPSSTLQTYTLLALENDHLRVTLLPELGGRVYQLIHKPTGHDELYRNPVIKPTNWGPPEQGWWLAVGGIEWCLPVDEHGYEWGEPWSYGVVTSTAGVTVTLQDTTAANRVRARIALHLPADRAVLEVSPRLENPTGGPLGYKYWTNAMLAPGPANTVGPDLRFAFGANQASVHSTGDDRLPGTWPNTPTQADHLFDWPVYDGIDFSRLGNWDEWLGFFEYPDAQDSFAGVYDEGADEGVVRVFPPDVARGSKGFGFGWAHPIDPNTWTDDSSFYVELHGGVAPTFWDEVTLAAGESVAWTETWYPVNGVGALSAASAEAALGVRQIAGRFYVGVHATVPRPAGSTVLYAWEKSTCAELARRELPAVAPGAPFATSLPTDGRTSDQVAFVAVDGGGNLLAAANPHDCLPPTASVEPLPAWVGTAAFTVTWTGQDAWSGIASYDVQARDGYEGAWSDWFSGTTVTSATYTGAHGHTYFFRARARDRFGAEGSLADEEWGQAYTTVLTEPAPVLVTSHKLACGGTACRCLFHPGRTIAYTITIANTGSLAAAAALTDTLPPELVVLTTTLAATSPPQPAHVAGRLLWNGTVEPGAEVRVTYVLSPTALTPFGLPLTNTAEVAGSVLGLLTRRAVAVKARPMWLPLVARAWVQ
jgi:uncharacterized repeat protein (TIGR01451 family)